jgi:hypothetical protein
METIIAYIIISVFMASFTDSSHPFVKGVVGFTWPLALYLKMTGGYEAYKATVLYVLMKTLGLK